MKATAYFRMAGLAAVAAAYLCLPAELAAQDLGATVSGQVLDPSKAAVAGAEVTLLGGRSGKRSAKTDESGAFRFEGVEAGGYRVRVEMQGFKPAEKRVNAGQRNPARLAFELELSTVLSEITIGAEERANSDPAGNLDTMRFDEQMLTSLPVLDQDAVAAITRLLGSAGGGAVSVMVDGLPASGVSIPASQIAEIKVNQNPYSAEFARPGASKIEIRTKVGSPQFHGSAALIVRDYRADARNPFAAERPTQRQRTFDGAISGPLGGKRRTFALTGWREFRDYQSLVYALTPAGQLRSNIPTPTYSTMLTGRIDQAVGKGDMLSVRYVLFDWIARGQGIGGFTLPEAGADQRQLSHSAFLSYKTVIGTSLISETSLRASRVETSTASRLAGVPKIIVLDAFTGGGAQNDLRLNENLVQFSHAISWTSGKHLVRTGINVPNLGQRQLRDGTNFDGAYQFSSLADYNLGRPFLLTQQRGDGGLNLWYEEFGVFFQDDIRVTPGLGIGLGVRYDWQSYLRDRNNVAPRVSIAWAPGKRRKTVLRSGAGLFFETTGMNAVADSLRYNGQRLRQFVFTNPAYPITEGSGSARPDTIVRFSPALKSPYLLQYSAGVEQEVAKSTTLTATYLGMRGVGMFRSRNVNAPPPPFYSQRPDPAIGVLHEIESAGRLEGHTAKVALQGRMTKYFSGLVQYSFERIYDNTTGIGYFPANQYDLTGEWSLSSANRRHGFYTYGSIDAGKLFKLGIVFMVYSGRPYTITTGRDGNADSFAVDRPAGVGRNTAMGPGFKVLDLRWSRDFRLRPAMKEKSPRLTLSVDAFNVGNWSNMNSIVGNLSSPFFGQPVSALAARRLQGSLRFGF